MRRSLTNRWFLPSLLCLLIAGAAAAETRYATVFSALPKGALKIFSTLFVTNVSDDPVDIDTFFVNRGAKGALAERTPDTLLPGEVVPFIVPDGFEIGYFGVDSDSQLLMKASVAVVDTATTPPTLIDIDEANVIGVGDAFAADTKAIVDAQWGISNLYVQNFGTSTTTCTADLFDDVGLPIVGGSGLTVAIFPMAMRRFHSVMNFIQTLASPVLRIEITCAHPFYPQGYFFDSDRRDISILSPEKEPDPPSPPTIIYDGFASFRPTKSNPQKVFEFRPPIGDYERFIVKWQITFGGWAPDGGNTDNIHGLLVLQWNGFRSGLMGSLFARGPNRNFIRDVWGFGQKNPQKARFSKSFNKFVVGKTYDLCYDFDLVAQKITIEILDAGAVIFKMTSPPDKSPDLGGSIHRGSADLFLIKLGIPGHEDNKSASVGWKYQIKTFELFPLATP